MKNFLSIIVILFGLSFLSSCNPDSISELEYEETESTGHGEVGDPDDNDEEEEVGG